MSTDTTVAYKGSDNNTNQRAMRNKGDGSLSAYMAIDAQDVAAITAPAGATLGASGATAQAQTVSAQTDIAFTPLLGRAIVLTVTGAGSAQLLRSVDGGTTKLPVTIGGDQLGPWTGTGTIINEPVWVEVEAGAVLYLRLLPSAGSMTGRIAQ